MVPVAMTTTTEVSWKVVFGGADGWGCIQRQPGTQLIHKPPPLRETSSGLATALLAG
jgi:hypothetical protein